MPAGVCVCVCVLHSSCERQLTALGLIMPLEAFEVIYDTFRMNIRTGFRVCRNGLQGTFGLALGVSCSSDVGALEGAGPTAQ